MLFHNIAPGLRFAAILRNGRSDYSDLLQAEANIS